MKSPTMLVITADQRASQRSADRVPEALASLAGVEGATLGFERTAGDEIQSLWASPVGALRCVRELSRLDGWRIGIGIGPVEQPLPPSTREARGPAYVAARTAVERARSVASELRLVAADAVVRGASYDGVDAIETVLWLLRSLWRRRTPEGWEVAQMLAAGHTMSSAAVALGISTSAVSQRAQRAHVAETERGVSLAVDLLLELGVGTR